MPVIQLVAKMRQHGQEMRNVLYYANTLGGTAEVIELAAELADTYDTILQPMLVDNWEFYGVDWRNLSAPGTPTFSVSVTPFFGSVVAFPTANQVAAVVSFTANATRPNRARNYIPGLNAESFTEAGEIVGSYQTILQNWGDATLQLSSGIGDAQNWTRQAVQLSPAGLLVDNNNLEYASVSPIPGTQRRRRIGSGS